MGEVVGKRGRGHGAHWSKIGELDGGRQRVWRFDEKIAVEGDWGTAWETADVVVSDSMVHAERLVLPVVACDALPMGDLSEVVEYRAEYLLEHVEGTYTFMVDGGDPSTVEPDEAYLGRLWEVAHR